MFRRSHAWRAWLCAASTLAVASCDSPTLAHGFADDGEQDIVASSARADGSAYALLARVDGDALQIGLGVPNVPLDCAAQSCLRLHVVPGADVAAVDMDYGEETFHVSMNTAGAMIIAAPIEVGEDEAGALALEELSSMLANAAAEFAVEPESTARGDATFGPYLCRPTLAEAKARKQRAAVACSFIVTSGAAAYLAVKKRKATLIPALEGVGASMLACTYALAKLTSEVDYEDYCASPAILRAQAPTASDGAVRWPLTLSTRIEVPGAAASPTTPILVELLENGSVVARQYAPFSTLGEAKTVSFVHSLRAPSVTYTLRASSEWIAGTITAGVVP